MPVEIIGITVIGLLILWEAVTSLVISTMRGDIQDRLVQLGLSNGDAESMVMAWNLIVWIIYFSLIYWVTGSIRNLISIGWKQAVRERIFLIPFLKKHRAKLEKACSFLKKKWSGLAKRVDIFFRIDLQEQSNKVIFRFVAAQFVIVSLFCMGWFFGIAGVLIYSVVLFRTICKKYYKIKQDYQRMLQATEKIASSNLDMSMEQDFGIFDPVRKQLLQIQSGFKSAVDEEVKSQKMKTELITNVSHDLKTPITAIKGYVEGIMDGVADTPERMDRYIKTIYNKANEMDLLINELTLYSKIDTNRIPYNFTTISAKGYFGDCGEDLHMELESKGIEFTYCNTMEEDCKVIVDPEQLRRVINNIVSNSLKYMDKPNGKVTMEVKDVGDFIQVELGDNGKGIAAKDLPYIFDRFYRTDASRNSSKGGSGIGLSIVKKIVEEHGGNIWATSEEGAGTTMYFVIRKYQEVSIDE